MLLHGLSLPHALSVLSDPPPERLIPLLENHKSLVEQKLLEKQTIIAFAKDLLREKKIDSQLKLNKFKSPLPSMKVMMYFAKTTPTPWGPAVF